THQARRPQFSVFHDAERFSDRENPLTDYHPAFHHHDHNHDSGIGDDPGSPENEQVLAASAVTDTVALFTALGWPEPTVKASIDYICERLARAGNRATAFEALRRDKHARALLDLPALSWHGLLRIVLGHPEPVYVGTSLGRGVLLRLLIGEPVPVLLRDDVLVLTITATIPVRGGGREWTQRFHRTGTHRRLHHHRHPAPHRLRRPRATDRIHQARRALTASDNHARRGAGMRSATACGDQPGGLADRELVASFGDHRPARRATCRAGRQPAA